MNTSLVIISNTGVVVVGQNVFSTGQTINEEITFTYFDDDREVISMFELSQAEINIFDSE